MFATMPRQPSLDPIPGKAGRNERRKAVATTLNAVAVAVVIAAVVQPLITGRLNTLQLVGASGFFLVLQSLLHYVLGRVED
jgi:hypothetical protein